MYSIKFKAAGTPRSASYASVAGGGAAARDRWQPVGAAQAVARHARLVWVVPHREGRAGRGLRGCQTGTLSSAVGGLG